jgi:endopolyphosphatase
MDHFFFLDAKQALEEEEDAEMLKTILFDDNHLNLSDLSPSEMMSLARLSGRDLSTLLDSHGSVHISGAEEYLLDLKDMFEQIPAAPKPKKKWEKGRKGRKQREKWEKEVIEYEENYQVVQVAPSIIPTYFTGMRVFEYNVSTLAGLQFTRQDPRVERINWKEWWAQMDRDIAEETGIEPTTEHMGGRLNFQQPDAINLDDLDAHAEEFESMRISRQRHSKTKDVKPKKPPPVRIPPGPHKSAPRGPLYESQLFTPLRWEVHFVNLTEINARYDDHPKKSWDYSKDFFRPEYSSDAAPYHMKDLTVATWLDLGRKVGKEKEAKNTDLFDGQAYATNLEDIELDFLDSGYVEDTEPAQDGLNMEKKKGKKHKGKKDKKGKKKKKPQTFWDVFLRRAFINSGHQLDFDD